MLTRDSESPATYSRNESYFDWRRVQRLRDRPVADLREELPALQEQVRVYRERYDAVDRESPEHVFDVLELVLERIEDRLRAETER